MSAGEDTHADFCVVGGGIVGLATALALLEAKSGASVVLLEREKRLASHQTGHNSGVIHAGIYYAPGSLKARLCKEGARLTMALCAETGIPFRQCGKLLVATDELELERMGALEARAAINGIDVQRLSRTELRALEPNLSGFGALLVPSSGIVDYGRVADAIAGRVRALGGTVRCDAGVVRISETARGVTLHTGSGAVHAAKAIFCSGVFADRMLREAGVRPDFRIVPVRGEYFRVTGSRSNLVSHLVYPIPDPGLPFLGVHLTLMIDGSLTVGPNAVLGLSRTGHGKFALNAADMADMASFPGFWRMLWRNRRSAMDELTSSLSKRRYLRLCRKYAPTLELTDLEPYPAGIRAQAVFDDGRLADDFLIRSTEHTVHVCNAPSPAATSALPIGRYVTSLLP